MQIDRYTKFMLTILTIGVWVLALAIFFSPTPLRALDEGNINIESIGGSSIYGAIPVEVKGTVTIDFEDGPVFELQD